MQTFSQIAGATAALCLTAQLAFMQSAQAAADQWSIWMGRGMIVPTANHVYIEVRKKKSSDKDATTVLRIQGMGKNLRQTDLGWQYSYSPLIADFIKGEIFVNSDAFPSVFSQSHTPGILADDEFHRNYIADYVLLHQGSDKDVLSRVTRMVDKLAEINSQCFLYETFSSNSNTLAATLVAAADLSHAVPKNFINNAPGFQSSFHFAAEHTGSISSRSVKTRHTLDKAISHAMGALQNPRAVQICARMKYGY